MSSRTLEAIPDIKALHWPRRENYKDFDEPTLTTDHHQHASSFLRLPRELRDMVYAYSLEAHRSPPRSPPFAGPRIFRLENEGEGAEAVPVPQKDIAYPISIAQSPAHALLATNRSTRFELLDLADKRNHHQPSQPAHLDIMATGYVLYPLWTRLPTLTNSTTTALNLTATIRIFTPQAFRTHDGPPARAGQAFHSLLTLLNQFVTCGPAFTTMAGGGCEVEPVEPVAVDTLTLRLANYDIYTPRMFAPAVYETVRMCKALARRADARRSLRRVRVVAEDPERCVPGFEGREWEFEVAGSGSDDNDEEVLGELEAGWEEMGFFWEAESARFGCG